MNRSQSAMWNHYERDRTKSQVDLQAKKLKRKESKREKTTDKIRVSNNQQIGDSLVSVEEKSIELQESPYQDRQFKK